MKRLCLFSVGPALLLHATIGLTQTLNCGAFLLEAKHIAVPAKSTSNAKWNFAGREIRLVNGAKFIPYSSGPGASKGLWAVPTTSSPARDLKGVVERQLREFDSGNDLTPRSLDGAMLLTNALLAWNNGTTAEHVGKAVESAFIDRGVVNGLLKPTLDLMDLAVGLYRPEFAARLNPAVSAMNPCVGASLYLSHGFPVRLVGSSMTADAFAMTLSTLDRSSKGTQASTLTARMRTLIYGETTFAQDSRRQAAAPSSTTQAAKSLLKDKTIFASSGNGQSKSTKAVADRIEAYKGSGFTSADCDEQCNPPLLFDRLSGEGTTPGPITGRNAEELKNESKFCRIACLEEKEKDEESKDAENKDEKKLPATSNAPNAMSPIAPSGKLKESLGAGSKQANSTDGEGIDSNPLCDVDPELPSCNHYRTPMELASALDCIMAKCPGPMLSGKNADGFPPIASSPADLAGLPGDRIASPQNWAQSLRGQSLKGLDRRSYENLRNLIQQNGSGGLSTEQLRSIEIGNSKSR